MAVQEELVVVHVTPSYGNQGLLVYTDTLVDLPSDSSIVYILVSRVSFFDSDVRMPLS